jgi:hypothetical protein
MARRNKPRQFAGGAFFTSGGDDVTVAVVNGSEAHSSGNDRSGSAVPSPDPLSDPGLRWA